MPRKTDKKSANETVNPAVTTAAEPSTTTPAAGTDTAKQPTRYLRRDEQIMTDFGRVILVDTDDETVDEITKILNAKREAELDITQSKVGRRILTDVVYGVEKVKGNYNNAVIIHANSIKVVIPANMFFPVDYSVERANRELDRRIGSKVDYIIDRYEKNEAGDVVIALASRREAMKAKSDIYFVGVNGDAPKFAEGDTTQARVLSTLDSGAVVDVGGVETFIYYAPTSARPSKGSNALITITGITKTDSGVAIKATFFSAITPFGASQLDYAIGSKYDGVVSGITNDGVFVTLGGGCSCYCRFVNKERPILGQTVNVEIAKRSNKDFLIGNIKYFG